MVLEPLTALSVAGTIVQFVEFGTKLFLRAHEIYNLPGKELSVNDRLLRAQTDLVRMSTKLIRPLRPPNSSARPTEDEYALEDLCCACNTIANEITSKIESLRVSDKNRVWQSLLVALKTVWNKDEIKELVSRLESFQRSLEMHVLVGVREHIDLAFVQMTDRFNKLDHTTQRIITALLDSQQVYMSRQLDDQTLAISQRLNRIDTVYVNTTRMQGTIIDAMTSGDAIDKQEVIDEDFGSQREDRYARQTAEFSVLEEFRFTTMRDRHEEVVEAHRETFEWVFRDPPTGTRTWSSFIDWLRSGRGVYWINGKAGSGKSTLMRYIYDNPKACQELSSWSGDKTLTITGFFFWNSGSSEQRSQIGLLRSLIYDILHQNRELIPLILPSLWARYYSQFERPVKPSEDSRPAWSSSQLMELFKKIIGQNIIPINLCLFIDGLDEYEGDHEQIAFFFQEVSSSANVKACLSSRPLLVFEDAFHHAPGLRVQDLTHRDIQNYIQDVLANKDRYRQLAMEELERAPMLVKDIILKADGVFLWVKLVVRSLLDGLGNRDTIADLQRRLMLLPGDLENLYIHMLGLIHPFYQARASQLFQIVRAAREQGNEEDPGLALNPIFEPLSQNEKVKRCQLMEDQIKSRCVGLLEVQGYYYDHPYFGVPEESTQRLNGKVQYLHRTARDFLEQPKVWQNIIAHTDGTGFCPHVALFRACLFQIKRVIWLSRNLQRTAFTAMRYAYFANLYSKKGNILLLDELDRAMMHAYPSQLHWGCIGEGAVFKSHHDSFLSLAVQYGLSIYVSEKLRRGDKVVKGKLGRPLLDYATNPVPAKQRYPASPEVIAVLLQHGASPNQEFNSMTIWERALRFFLEESSSRSEVWKTEYESSPAMARGRLSILKLLVEYGADPNAYCETPDGLYTALEIVRPIFQKQLPSEISNVESLLEQRGARDTVSWFRKVRHILRK